MKRNAWSQGLSVTADGTGVVALAGSAALRLLADKVGLTGGLSAALARRSFVPVHDRGQVLVDVATVLAAGGEAIGDIDALRHQPVWGAVASPATVWRALDEVTPAALARIGKARARARRRVWELLPDGVPASAAAGTDLGDTVVLDVDATLVTAHSEKEQAAANFKGGFGFHPLGVWCDNTRELLAIRLRPGNANANHAGDHISVLADAIGQIPPSYRRRLLVRADSAGATHQLLDWLHAQHQIRGRSVEYSIGFPVHKGIAVHDAIHTVPESAWQAALDADGEPRDQAGVVELSGLVDLTRWPAGMRLIVRREKPHPGAGLTLFEQADAGATKPSSPTPAPVNSASSRPATAPTPESRTGSGSPKTAAWGRLPSREYSINQAWVRVAAIAGRLMSSLLVGAGVSAGGAPGGSPSPGRRRSVGPAGVRWGRGSR